MIRKALMELLRELWMWSVSEWHLWWLKHHVDRYLTHLAAVERQLLKEPKQSCPDDPSHFLAAHAPGGSWYGAGHFGKPSPWPVKRR